MAGISTSLAIKDKFTSTLNRAEQGVNSVLKSMRNLDVQSLKMNPSKMFNYAKNSINQSSNSVDNFVRKQDAAAKGSKKVANGWKDVKGYVLGAVAALGLVEGAQAVDSYVGIQARLGLITDSLEEQKQLQDDVYNAAMRSRGVYNDMANSVAKLGLLAGDAFSSNDEMVAFAELMQKSFALSGASTMEQQSGMYQLTQAMAAGKLQGDEFRSIMENAPMLANAISAYTGKTKGELKEMSADGEITADIIKGALFSMGDEINKMFGNMPMTFGGAVNQIKTYATNAFSGVMQTINGFLNSTAGETMIIGIMGAIDIVAASITGFIDLINMIGQVVTNNWNIILPILIGLGAILALWIYQQFPLMIVRLWSMVAPVLIQAAAWMAMNWQIMLIGLAIAAVAAVLISLGVTFEDVFGFIGGILGGFYAFFYNLFADLWNLLATFGEFFANFLSDPVGSIIRLIYDMFDVVMGVVETIANAIDAVFDTGVSDAVRGFRDNLSKQVDETFGKGKVELDRMDKIDTGEAFDSGFDIGKDIGKDITDAVGELFKKPPEDDKDKTQEIVNQFGGAGGDNFVPDVGKVDKVGKIEKEVNIADEDLQMLKDIAEMKYVQNFVTLTPQVSMQATISEKVDIDDVMNSLAKKLDEEIAANAESVYA